MPKKTAGTIHNTKYMALRMHVGTAESDGVAYEMSVDAGLRTPIVRSKQTGKWFTLSWNEIVNMAVAAGVDK